MSRGNNVRGPTSALTEFLRESGITFATVARRARTAQDPQQQPIAGPSNAPDNDDADVDGDDAPEAGPSRRNRAGGYNSDELDEPDEDDQPPPKKQKLSKAAQAKLTAKQKADAKKKAKKGKKGDDDGDYEDDSEEDPYNALSKSLWNMGGSSTPKPPVGSFDTCAKCEKQFTVTKYTMAANPGPGFLCHQCAKTSGIDPFKKPALPRKRKPAADKRTVVHYQERRFPSLAAICIQIISRHIDEVEMLGDIGSVNLDEIAKSLARNRSLTPENAHLFYDVQNTNLTLYDATKLTPPALSTLAMLNPNLTHLRLDYCGLMDDATLHTFSTSLPHLTHIQLLGPFLVRVPAWLSFFRSHPALETFSIEQSPRFDEECVKTLVEECGKSLREVRLKEVGKMSDGFLTELAKCEELRLLDLSYPGNGKSLSDEGCIELMSVLGETLESLDLSGHPELTDEFLRDGLGQYAKRITSLSLSDLPQLTDEGVSALFDTFAGLTTAQPQPKKIKKKHAPETSLTNHRLTHVSLSHNPSLSSLSLTSLLTHSGPSLSTLSLNGWKSVSPEALQDIPKACRENLVKVDLGWCREVDDFLVRDLVEMCGKLEEVKVWGCNKLSGACLRGLKRKVTIQGIELV